MTLYSFGRVIHWICKWSCAALHRLLLYECVLVRKANRRTKKSKYYYWRNFYHYLNNNKKKEIGRKLPIDIMTIPVGRGTHCRTSGLHCRC